jgi:hypothetical protein
LLPDRKLPGAAALPAGAGICPDAVQHNPACDGVGVACQGCGEQHEAPGRSTPVSTSTIVEGARSSRQQRQRLGDTVERHGQHNHGGPFTGFEEIPLDPVEGVGFARCLRGCRIFVAPVRSPEQRHF